MLFSRINISDINNPDPEALMWLRRARAAGYSWEQKCALVLGVPGMTEQRAEQLRLAVYGEPVPKRPWSTPKCDELNGDVAARVRSEIETQPEPDTVSVKAKFKPNVAELAAQAETRRRIQNLPAVLKPLMDLPNWVIWRWEKTKTGKPTKVPYRAADPQSKALTNDPATWSDYNTAVAAATQADGIGFCLLGTDIAALDLDNCRDPNTEEVHAWARALVDEAGSYAEVTVSGTGLRIIGRGIGPRVQRKLAVVDGVSCEFYRNCERYITMSGWQLGEAHLINIDGVMDETLVELERAKTSTGPATPKDGGHHTRQSVGGDVKVEIDALPVSERMRNLIHGIHDPAHHYASRSEAEFAVLVALVAGGCTDEQMAAVIFDENLPIGAHTRDQAHPRKYLAGQIAKAHERAGDDTHRCDVLDVVCMADVIPQPIRWLWYPRFAIGKLSLIVGLPDLGKSMTTIDMIARVSKGRSWPNGEGPAPLGSAIILSAEDDPADTIRNRLDAADADVSRVHTIRGVKGTGRRGFDLTRDIERLEELARKIGDVVLIVIDPISAYLGRPGRLDSHRNTDIRATLEPLSDLASRIGAAVVAISHLPKGGSTEAAVAAIGSIAFSAAARAVHLVIPAEDDPSRLLFLRGKNNLAPKHDGLAYRIVEKPATHPIRAPGVDWETGTVTLTANEALAAGRKTDRRPSATDFLNTILVGGPLSAKAIEEQAARLGISKDQLNRAKKKLGIEPKKDGFTGGWQWELPGMDGPL